jgi:hypothetical protein
MGPSTLQSLDAGVDDVARRVEIGLANLEVDDVASFGFEGTGFY